MLIVCVQYAITGCLPLPTEPMQLNRVVHAKLLNKGMKLCIYSIKHEISHVFSVQLKLTLTSYLFDPGFNDLGKSGLNLKMSKKKAGKHQFILQTKNTGYIIF